jgi:hypothetical protein
MKETFGQRYRRVQQGSSAVAQYIVREIVPATNAGLGQPACTDGLRTAAANSGGNEQSRPEVYANTDQLLRRLQSEAHKPHGSST